MSEFANGRIAVLKRDCLACAICLARPMSECFNRARHEEN